MKILKKLINLKIFKNKYNNKNFFLTNSNKGAYVSKSVANQHFNFDKFCFVTSFIYPDFSSINSFLIRFYKYYIYNFSHYKYFNFYYVNSLLKRLFLIVVLKIKQFKKIFGIKRNFK